MTITIRSPNDLGRHLNERSLDSLPPHPCPFTVAVDSREQLPWTFDGIVISGRRWQIRTQVATLATGDYSIIGCEHLLTIERKSVADLLGCVAGPEHAREKRKHERMREMIDRGGFARVVIEGCLSATVDWLNDPTCERSIHPNSIYGCHATWDRTLAPWCWAGSRRAAEVIAFWMMLDWWQDISGESRKGKLK